MPPDHSQQPDMTMTGSRWLIMLLLAVLTVLFTAQAARIWLQPLQAQGAVENEGEADKVLLPPVLKKRQPPKSAYDVIAARNLFDRTRTEGETGIQVGNLKGAETSRYAKRIGLFGVIINDGEKTALVNKDMGRRGGDDFLWVRVGDQIERLKVVGIERDRIYLQENGSRYEILLSDQRHANKRTRDEKDSGPTVISTAVKPKKVPESGPQSSKIRVKAKKEAPPSGD
jgi:hypothetical protein